MQIKKRTSTKKGRRHFIAFPSVRRTQRNRRIQTRKTRQNRKQTRKSRKSRRGGGVLIPSIHPASIVAVQPDESSPSLLTDVDTAYDMLEMREPYLL